MLRFCILRPGIFSGVNAIVQCNIGKQQNRENQLADRIYFGGTIGNPDTAAQYEIHKQDLLRKVKEGKGHWKPELASDSEEAVCFLYLLISISYSYPSSLIHGYPSIPWRENEENRFCVGIFIHTYTLTVGTVLMICHIGRRGAVLLREQDGDPGGASEENRAACGQEAQVRGSVPAASSQPRRVYTDNSLNQTRHQPGYWNVISDGPGGLFW